MHETIAFLLATLPNIYRKNSLVPSATGYRPTSIVHKVGLHAANDLVEDDSIELARRSFWS